MKKYLILVLFFSLPFVPVEANEQVSYETTQAEIPRFEIPGTQVIPIRDTQADKQYELYIKLPEGYSENKNSKYPVIYFTDAVWHIELLSASTAFLMEEVILVGISWQKDVEEDLKQSKGTHVSRFRDYSLSQSSDPERQAKYKFGQASNHLNFIRNDVFKYVESSYRTDPENRAYFGYSLGGLFGAYILMSQPDTFKNYILGSPSLWRDIPRLSEAGSKHKALNSNVLLSYGSTENDLSEHINEFIKLLKKRNDKSLSIKRLVVEGSHQTAFPATGVSSVTWLSNLQSKGDK